VGGGYCHSPRSPLAFFSCDSDHALSEIQKTYKIIWLLPTTKLYSITWLHCIAWLPPPPWIKWSKMVTRPYSIRWPGPIKWLRPHYLLMVLFISSSPSSYIFFIRFIMDAWGSSLFFGISSNFLHKMTAVRPASNVVWQKLNSVTDNKQNVYRHSTAVCPTLNHSVTITQQQFSGKTAAALRKPAAVWRETDKRSTATLPVL